MRPPHANSLNLESRILLSHSHDLTNEKEIACRLVCVYVCMRAHMLAGMHPCVFTCTHACARLHERTHAKDKAGTHILQMGQGAIYTLILLTCIAQAGLPGIGLNETQLRPKHAASHTDGFMKRFCKAQGGVRTCTIVCTGRLWASSMVAAVCMVVQSTTSMHLHARAVLLLFMKMSPSIQFVWMARMASDQCCSSAALCCAF